MPEVAIRPPQPGDAEALAANLRPADRDEVDALIGPGQAQRVIEDGWRVSVLAWCATVDGVPACAFGVAPINMLAGVGAPWMLGTPLVEQHRRALIRLAPAYIARMLAVFPHLLNVVDARNVKAVAWLRRSGFELRDPEPMGRASLPFHFFTMDA